MIGALDYGGEESTALSLLNRLPVQSIESHLYFIGETITERYPEFVGASATFTHCPYQPSHRIKFIRQLSAALRRDAIDVVMPYSLGNHAWVSMAARLAGIRQCYVRVASSPLRDPLSRRKNLILAHLARPFCLGEIAVSKQIRHELIDGLRLPDKRVHLIENGCAVGEIAERAANTRRQRAVDKPPIILMIARMDDAKDHGTLIRACARLIHSGFSLTLRLAGDGPFRAQHEALCRQEKIENSVEFLGNRSDVPELLGTSDISVLATHTEGLPHVLAEGMSAGTPIIATDILVCREVLDNGRCGILVSPRNPDALAEAIRGLLENPALRERLTRAAEKRVSDVYNISKAVEKYTALLTGGNGNSLSR